MPFNFVTEFESISRWSGNQRLLVQFLETEVFSLVFADPKSAVRARFQTEQYSWAIRMDKISELAQFMLDTAVRHTDAPVPHIDYSQVISCYNLSSCMVFTIMTSFMRLQDLDLNFLLQTEQLKVRNNL